MDNKLKVELIGLLNEKLSIADINKGIQRLSQHKDLQKLRLKVEFGSKNALNDLNKNFSKLFNLMKSLTGIDEKFNASIKKNSKDIEKQTQDIAKQTEELKKNQKIREKIVEDSKKGTITNITTTGSKNNNTTTKSTLNNDGTVVVDSEIITRINHDAIRREELRKQQQYQKQLEKYDRDHYNALKTNKAKKEAMEKAHFLALEQNRQRDLAAQRKANVEAQRLATIKQQAEKKVTSLISQYGANSGRIDAKRLKELLAAIKGITDSSAAGTKAAAKLRHEIDLIGASGKKMSAIQQAFSKFPIWMLTATAFLSPLRALNQIVDTIILIDTQMTSLKRVMDDDTNFNNVLRESISLATMLGQTITNLNEILIEFSRMGLDENQILHLTKAAALMQNISEMSSTQAINALTAAMTVFNIRAEDSLRIADALNEIDNNYSVTSANLAVSLNKAASAAHTFGVSMEQMLGHSTAIMTATRESGAIVGMNIAA